MKVSASKAAEAVGKSVPTITRAIKNGRLSAKKLDGGGYEIDVAELHRVFEPVKRDPVTKPNTLGGETPAETSVLQGKVEALLEQIAMADTEREREREQLTEQIEELRKINKEQREDFRQSLATITDQRPKATEPPKRRLFGLLRA